MSKANVHNAITASYNESLVSVNILNKTIETAISKKILITTGGTGGHIFPALALEKMLKEKGFDTLMTGDARFAKFHNFDKTHVFIPSAPFASKSLKNIASAALTLTKGFFKSLWIIYKSKPDIVVGFGGYPTFPVLIAAILFRRKIILHEANTIIGKVNKLFLWNAKYLTTGFKDIFGVEPKYMNKVIYTGNPVRSEIAQVTLKSDNDKLSILIIGGSQGAKVFSKMIPDMIVNLPAQIKEKLFIYQQAREEDVDLIKSRYAHEKIPCEIKSFFDDMNDKFKEANLVIARSGASTISELIKVGIPAIFIPYPTAADNHQYLNAKAIVDMGAAWLVKEDNNSHIELLQIIKSIDNDPSILKRFSNILRQEDLDASDNIIKLISKI